MALWVHMIIKKKRMTTVTEYLRDARTTFLVWVCLCKFRAGAWLLQGHPVIWVTSEKQMSLDFFSRGDTGVFATSPPSQSLLAAQMQKSLCWPENRDKILPFPSCLSSQSWQDVLQFPDMFTIFHSSTHTTIKTHPVLYFFFFQKGSVC